MSHRVYLFALLTVLAPVGSPAQDFDQLFQWKASPDALVAPAGGAATVTVMLTVADGHMIYHEDLTLEVEGNDQLRGGSAVYPQPVRKWDEFSQAEADLYPSGTYTFLVPVLVAPDAAGQLEAVLAVGYRGCSDSVCFFPQRLELPLRVRVEGQASGAELAWNAAAGAAEAVLPPPAVEQPTGNQLLGAESPDAFAGLLGQGRILSVLVLLFVAGFWSSFLPCVYPIIPLTISTIGAAGAKTRLEAFLLSCVFVLGMALMFSVLGVVAAMFGQISGALLAGAGVQLVLVALFVALALSMFGLYELQLPASLSNRLAAVGGSGYGGAFAMGGVAGLLATPCTGPVLVGILAYIAQTKSLLLGFAGLFIYAWGLGLLFLAVGTFSGMLSTLPRSGKWMDKVKSLFGIAFLVVAFYYAKSLIPALNDFVRPNLVVIAVGLVLAVAGLALGAVHLAYRPGLRARKLLGAAVMAFGVFLAAAAPLADPPPPAEWLTDHDAALALGRQTGRPVMIDFYTENCANCKKLARETFPHPLVAPLLEQFVVAKVDLTDYKAPTPARLRERYNIIGVPLIVFYDSQGRERADLRINNFVPPAEFKEILAQVR